jgi:hypothetical protein
VHKTNKSLKMNEEIIPSHLQREKLTVSVSWEAEAVHSADYSVILVAVVVNAGVNVTIVLELEGKVSSLASASPQLFALLQDSLSHMWLIILVLLINH